MLNRSTTPLPAAAYRQQLIAFRPADRAITFNYISPPDVPSKSDLLGEAREAFASVSEADIYILTVDRTTAEDRISVPVQEDEVPAAWVRAAMAWTDYDYLVHDVNSGDKSESKLAVDQEYALDVLDDLLLGLSLALVTDFALGFVQRRRHRVLRQIGFVVAPIGIAALFGVAYMLSAARSLSVGAWHSPAIVLIGMMFHSYVHAANKGGAEAHSADEQRTSDVARPRRVRPPFTLRHVTELFGARTALKRRHVSRGRVVNRSLLAYAKRDPIRAVAQWLWSLLLCASLWFGLLPNLATDPRMIGVGIAAAIASMYLVAALRYNFLPLPWRSAVG